MPTILFSFFFFLILPFDVITNRSVEQLDGILFLTKIIAVFKYKDSYLGSYIADDNFWKPVFGALYSSKIKNLMVLGIVVFKFVLNEYDKRFSNRFTVSN